MMSERIVLEIVTLRSCRRGCCCAGAGVCSCMGIWYSVNAVFPGSPEYL